MQNIFDYDMPLFRPPSEANSLIIQTTIGCSWNNCAFCEMYTSKKFRVRDEKEVFEELRKYVEYEPNIRKVFIADGNAMVLSTKRLISLLSEINRIYPRNQRISAYALPSDLKNKSIDELKELYNLGLKLIYVGIETGDDELLTLINKSETTKSTIENLLKAKEAGIEISAMILNGLGGLKYSINHAFNSAKVINEIQPELLSTLVLSFPFGIKHYQNRFKGEYLPMKTQDLFNEMKIFIENLNLKSTIFRSDHSSNYLVLKGILSRDKARLIEKIDTAINTPQDVYLRKEWQRGL